MSLTVAGEGFKVRRFPRTYHEMINQWGQYSRKKKDICHESSGEHPPVSTNVPCT